VASSWNEVTPATFLWTGCQAGKEGVAPPGVPFEFVTIAVSDGISMGTRDAGFAGLTGGDRDSIETVMHAERFDALVTFAGCDKSLPGMLMAAARINLPSVFLYGARSSLAGSAIKRSTWSASSRRWVRMPSTR